MQLLLADSEIVPQLCNAIEGAALSVIILQYQFRVPLNPRAPMRRVLNALTTAATRGVPVTILLNNPNRPKRPGPSHGAIRKWLQHPNITILHHDGQEILHTKLCLVDYSLTLLGSHNLSQQGLTRSRNLSLLTDSPEVAKRATTIAVALIKRAHDAPS
jgi:phosphatidylserine/phosphatidylglycerophosphate/cardiolipin synthase-like enzyme